MKTYGDVLEYAIQQKRYGHDVFVEYSPYVNKIDIGVYKHGWSLGKKADGTIRAYLSERSPQDFIDFINSSLENDDAEENF